MEQMSRSKNVRIAAEIYGIKTSMHHIAKKEGDEELQNHSNEALSGWIYRKPLKVQHIKQFLATLCREKETCGPHHKYFVFDYDR